MAQLFGDRYELLRPLGAGGMGAVFLALDTWRPEADPVEASGADLGRAPGVHLGREVVLKSAPPGDERMAEALAREFIMLSLLRHPGVVMAHDFGWCSRARQPFFTMDVGGAVDAARAAGERSVADIAAIAARVCEALAFVHSRGIVHADVKAENILVREGNAGGDGSHGGVGPVTLADFGVARPVGSPGAATFSGTLTHAAPELLAGGSVDARTDLYALGVTLFALLTGRLPFDDHDPIALAEAHRASEAPSVRSFRADVPEALSALVARLLAKDPRRRPATAHVVLASLRGVFPEVADEADASRQAWCRAPRLIDRELAEEACEGLVGLAQDPARPGSRVLAVEGAEGTGKTRLLRETMVIAQSRRIATLWGAPAAEPWSLLAGPLRDALRLAGIAPANAPAALALIDPGLGSAGEPLSSGLSAEDLRLAVGRAVWDVLGLAAIQPTILVLDDIDRCDSESRWILEYLLRQMGRPADRGHRLPFAILVASTPRDAAAPLAAMPAMHATLRLSALDAEGAKELVLSMFPGCRESEALLRVLWDGVGAQAALIESWCSGLVREGALVADGNGWTFDSEHPASRSPPRDLAASVAGSLAQLPSPERALLLDLALLPRAVDMLDLAAAQQADVLVASGSRDGASRSSFAARVSALERRELARVSVREDARSLAIASELVREASLAGADAVTRTERAAALLVAPRLALALGAADRAHLAVSAERLDVARALLGEALADAEAREDHARSSLFAARLADITTDRPQRDAHRRGAAALIALERLDDASRIAALSGVDASDDEAAEQAMLEGRLELRRGRAARAAELFGIAVARADVPAEELAEWRLEQARAASAAGREDARELLGALAENIGEDRAAVRVLLASGAHELRWQRTAEAVAILGRAAALARALGATMEEASCENNLGVAALRIQDEDAAAKHLDRSIKLRLARGARGAAAGALMNLVLLELNRGRAAAALKAARQCLSVHEEVGSVRGELLSRINMAVAHGLREDWSSCDTELRRAQELEPQVGDPHTHAACVLMEAELLRSMGLRDRSAASAREAIRAAMAEKSESSLLAALTVAASCGDAFVLAEISALLAHDRFKAQLRISAHCVLVDRLLDGSAWTTIGAVATLAPSRGEDLSRAREWAMAAFGEATARQPSELLAARLALALVEIRSGEIARAAEVLAAVSAAEEKAARPSMRAVLAAARGWIAAATGDLAHAETCAERAVEIARSQHRRIPRAHRQAFLASQPWAGFRDMLIEIRTRRIEAERAAAYFSVLRASEGGGSLVAEAGPAAGRAVAAAVRRADRLAEILEISRGINALLPVAQLLEATLRSAMRFMDADRGFIVLCSPAGLEFAASRDRSDRPLARAEFAISRSVLDEVISTKQTVLSANAREDERFVRGASVLALDLRSVLVAPLVASAEVVGAIYLDNHHASGVFTEEDRELLALLATQAAVAVENARLHGVLVEKERIDNELGIARTIQQGLLPTGLPGTSAFVVAAAMEPAREIGGDYYDFIEAGDDRLWVAIGDVAGKGVAAGLFMVMARTILRSLAATAAPLDRVLAQANDALESQIEDDKFMTMLLLEPSNDGRAVRACVAGHEPPIIWRREGGTIEALPAGGLALGMLPSIDSRLEEIVVPMAPGDVMACFSDGITECRSSAGEFFGRERLEAVVAASGAGGAQSVLDGVLASIARFRGTAERSDDITLVILEARA